MLPYSRTGRVLTASTNHSPRLLLHPFFLTDLLDNISIIAASIHTSSICWWRRRDMGIHILKDCGKGSSGCQVGPVCTR